MVYWLDSAMPEFYYIDGKSIAIKDPVIPITSRRTAPSVVFIIRPRLHLAPTRYLVEYLLSGIPLYWLAATGTCLANGKNGTPRVNISGPGHIDNLLSMLFMPTNDELLLFNEWSCFLCNLWLLGKTQRLLLFEAAQGINKLRQRLYFLL